MFHCPGSLLLAILFGVVLPCLVIFHPHIIEILFSPWEPRCAWCPLRCFCASSQIGGRCVHFRCGLLRRRQEPSPVQSLWFPRPRCDSCLFFESCRDPKRLVPDECRDFYSSRDEW